MIIGVLFLLGAVALLFLAWRGARRGDQVRAEGTRIVVEAPPGASTPLLRLESGDTTVFGPVAADWAPRLAVSQALGNADAAAGRAGGAAAAGSYRVVALVDLAAPGSIGSGDTALDGRIAGALGGSAMILVPAAGGAPILLHGAAQAEDGSIGGIALPAAQFAALVAQIGDARGLAVEVLRRRIQRAGWGGERAQRRRRG